MTRGVSRRGSLVVVALGLCAGLAGCGGGSDPASSPAPSVTASVTPSDPPILEIVARVPVGGEPIGIVAAFGSIWVVNSEFDSGEEPSLSRIDPTSATVEATVAVGRSRWR